MRLALAAVLIGPCAQALARSPHLPSLAPLPQLKTEAAPPPPALAPATPPPASGDNPAAEPPGPADVPVPQVRPAGNPAGSDVAPEPDSGAAAPAVEQPKGSEIKPGGSEIKPGGSETKPGASEGAGAKPNIPDPRSAEQPAATMPAGELACRARLKALGVVFEEHKAEHDAAVGCSIPYPIVVSKLGPSIAIAPQAELNCAMTEAAARFMADIVSPAARADLGSDLTSISQASAYVCRPRHGTHKISEHAFGNALDIATFSLADGTAVNVGPVPPQKQANFLGDVRKAACGPFKTVLGPGSDPDHALHFHLDLEPRRHGGTFCQ